MSKVTSIGGQALMEGIMMVGPYKTVAAFCSEKGEISTEEIEAPSLRKKYPVLNKPFLRGIFAMIDSLRLGYKALSLSADKITEDMGEEELTGLDKWLDEHLGEKMTGVVMSLAAVLGVGLAILLFFLLPSYLFNLIQAVAGDAVAPLRSVFEGLLRIGVFIAYILLISLMPDIKRVFQYHGAEHKTIFCYEADLPLTVENVRKQGRFHPRCGTSFMILMLLIGIIIGFFIPFTNPFARTGAKLLCIPIVMNIGYEVQKFSARHFNLCTRVLVAPGLWMQRLTVKEPDDKMIEAAIAAMRAVIPENGEDLIR